jgi:hypothetical protein
MALPGVPEDFQVVIEYENLLDKPYPRNTDIAAHRTCAEPLVATIRQDWPESTLRILLHETRDDAETAT